jgi:Winged helix DNA-binding domain
MAVARFSDEQRRVRLARRQMLARETPATNPVAAARRVFGLHASDPATVYLSAWARVPGMQATDLSEALYETRTLLRHMCMRRTMFTLPIELVPVAQVACGLPVGAATRRRLVKELELAGIAADGGQWLDAAMRATMEALADLGPSTGAQIAAAVPLLRTRLASGPQDAAVTPRVLTLMGMEGRLVRDRPVGTWVSSTHRWALAPSLGDLPSERDAVTELVRRWLAAFGPAPVTDIVWWTGLGVTKVRPALAAIGAVEVALDSGPGIALPDDLDLDGPIAPWVALLPSLDPTPMGWKSRDWFLGDHAGRVFDQNGNIGPTVWSDGRIVGGWAQHPSGAVRVELFDDIGSSAANAVAARAAELQLWLGDVRVSPRFPTPIDRTLRAP